MNRRDFTTTIGSIASLTALAGCGSLGSIGNPTSHIEGTVKVTEGFAENAKYDDVTYGHGTTDDGDKYTTIGYTLTPDPANENRDCIQTEVSIKAFNTDGAVISKNDQYGDAYDTGDSYEVEHTIPEPPADIERIEMTLHVTLLGLLCSV